MEALKIPHIVAKIYDYIRGSKKGANHEIQDERHGKYQKLTIKLLNDGATHNGLPPNILLGFAIH